MTRAHAPRQVVVTKVSELAAGGELAAGANSLREDDVIIAIDGKPVGDDFTVREKPTPSGKLSPSRYYLP